MAGFKPEELRIGRVVWAWKFEALFGSPITKIEVGSDGICRVTLTLRRSKVDVDIAEIYPSVGDAFEAWAAYEDERWKSRVKERERIIESFRQQYLELL